MIVIMRFLLKFSIFGKKFAEALESPPTSHLDVSPPRETALLRTLSWFSAGAGALALGLFIGRELRSRYKFNRRTPYDFYAHSGDAQDMEFGVGI